MSGILQMSATENVVVINLLDNKSRGTFNNNIQFQSKSGKLLLK